VSWFLGQSWLMLLLSFLLGCLITWWLLRRRWEKVHFSESDAVTRVSEQHSTLLAEKNAEISRLRALLATPAAAQADATPAAAADADVAAGTVVAAESDVATLAADADVDAAPAVEPVQTASLVDVENVDTPSVDLTSVDDAAQDTSVDLGAIEAESVDVSADAVAAGAVDITGVPQVTASQADVSEITPVVDLSEAGAPTEDLPVDESVAAAVPAQGSTAAAAPEQAVIDLADAGQNTDDTTDEDSGDDLERIEGIGPRIAGALRSAGIHTFAKLADSDVATLQAALEASGLRFAPSLPTWARQSRLLADGDETGFTALTEQLVAGRDTGRTV
jgi:predicted flap endonuclease-1-like 5' DNA nuclease